MKMQFPVVVVGILAAATANGVAQEQPAKLSPRQQRVIAAIGEMDGAVIVDETDPDRPVITAVSLAGPKITDAELIHLTGLPNLRTLWLLDTQVTGAGLVHLKQAAGLKTLNCRGSPIADTRLAHLQGFTKLEFLARISHHRD